MKTSNSIFQDDSLGRTHREGAGKGSAARHWDSADEIGKFDVTPACDAAHFPALLIGKISLGQVVKYKLSGVCF